MMSVISIKRRAEELPDIQIIKTVTSFSQSKRRQLRRLEKMLKQLEIKERIILLAHLLAQLKISLLTHDDEKIAHIASKFLHGDVCNLEGIKADIRKANEHFRLSKDLPIGPHKKTIAGYAAVHSLIRKEFNQLISVMEKDPV